MVNQVKAMQVTAANSQQLLKRSASLPFIELRQARHSQACYHSHSHDEFSFGLIDTGDAVYKNMQQQHRITAGHNVTINPGDVHSCNPKQGAWSYRMLFVDSHWVGELQQEMLVKPASDYQPFEQHYADDPATFTLLAELFSAIKHDHDGLQQESLLIQFFESQFGQGADVRRDASCSAKPQIKRVQECIQDQLSCSLSLSELAEVAGLSRYHLVRSFKRRYGLSPHAFQLNQRINRAKTLLREGSSIADTALALGFADQSHFQRNFKKRLALTPRQYQGFFV
ncbi:MULTISPECIES: AraC family transcriptional regulator [unclassified Agarivorans]|uniref:AraC family transcriptional regulator n=1 Tax=unclassified Agarivorans TaxID=2636026 RepID=UPI0026E2D56D|nr:MULTISPECIES: AraC family transcriptional regulator [unclassified Agarivorans]MDO6683993.1 helix-turn-helix transcriptional regulator [Agarivorans sp. 3_MG-2023]MDO6714274.1 helix-turn-helix transcriptional regulator [Agarivorans sp. 2_MG-2023]